MTKSRLFAVAAAAAVTSLGITSVAHAACTRLAFSVNDYGKEGPARDARNLLDKYIAKWTADRNIKQYTVGKKETTCELFIDLIVFDEYTCKAAATVCWSGPMPPGHTTEAGSQPPVLNKAAQRPRPAAATSAPVTTGSVQPRPAAAPGAAPAGAAPAAAPAAPKAAPAAAPAPAPAAN